MPICDIIIDQSKKKSLNILNYYELQKLKTNYESVKNEVCNEECIKQIETFTGCYFLFTFYKMLVYKFKKGDCYRKVVNHWRIFDYNEFIEVFNMTEWKIL